MKKDGIDERSFANKVKELSLSGDYRKIIEKPTDLHWQILYYDDYQIPLSVCDHSKILKLPEPISTPGGKFRALQIAFTLPSSTYATMCFRELLKSNTSLDHQKMLNNAFMASTVKGE